jgi:hypothetical protein
MPAVSSSKMSQFTLKNAMITAEATIVLLLNLTTNIQQILNASVTVLTASIK